MLDGLWRMSSGSGLKASDSASDSRLLLASYTKELNLSYHNQETT